MGLFDYIQTDLTLPTLPESTENGRTVKSYPFKKGHQFQTKDLHNYMGEFKIGDDNQLYELKNELSAIESQSLSYKYESESDLINLKWIFILLFVFLTIEWFLRKRITNI